MENGKETVNARQKGVYAAKGQLSAIRMERCLSKMELEPEGTAEVTTAADGTATLVMKDAKAREQMKIIAAYDKSGRANRVSMTFGTRTQTLALTRNAAGLVTRAVSEDGNTTMTAEYEMDAKGNWTKATVATHVVKDLDGKEKKKTKEVVRKITY